ncbi:hypothetical protein KP509_04G032200 [Ceratopteris richardii]|nr:hypothetical protein KP509_04G032200 [Ceratopteris richardii]
MPPVHSELKQRLSPGSNDVSSNTSQNSRCDVTYNATVLVPTVKSVTDFMYEVCIQHTNSNDKENCYDHHGNELEVDHNKNHAGGREDATIGTIAADNSQIRSSHALQPGCDVNVEGNKSHEEVVVHKTDNKLQNTWSNDEAGGDDASKVKMKDHIMDKDDGNSMHEDDDEDEDEDEDEEEEEDGEEEDESESEDSNYSSSTSTSSFSSSTDDEMGNYRLVKDYMQKSLGLEPESECEEGELKDPCSHRNRANTNKKIVDESSEDEGGSKEPVQSRKDIEDLPPVPKVCINLQPHHTMVPIGYVSSMIELKLIVEGTEGLQPLAEGSILWLTEQRSPLGIVDELFGPVKKPFYVVRYNTTSEVPDGAREGAQVSYVRDFADFVLNNSDLYAKGYDNFAEDEEDLSDSEVAFSDDEKEAEFRRLKSRTKRVGRDSMNSTDEVGIHQRKKSQGNCYSKDSKGGKSRRESLRKPQFKKDFSGRPPRHSNLPIQHNQNEELCPMTCGYGSLTCNNVPIQGGSNIRQDVLPTHQHPNFFQQISASNEYIPFNSSHIVTQVPSNMITPMGSQMQMAHVNGYHAGSQSAAGLTAPVLGIPVALANTSSNYSFQGPQSQLSAGFTISNVSANAKYFPSMQGVPDQLRPVHPMESSHVSSAHPWQQQYSPQARLWWQSHQQKASFMKPEVLNRDHTTEGLLYENRGFQQRSYNGRPPL